MAGPLLPSQGKLLLPHLSKGELQVSFQAWGRWVWVWGWKFPAAALKGGASLQGAGGGLGWQRSFHCLCHPLLPRLLSGHREGGVKAVPTRAANSGCHSLGTRGREAGAGGAVEGPHGIEESGCIGTSRFPLGLGRFL